VRRCLCWRAGAMGLGIATAPSPFWPGPILSPSAITAIGCIRQIHPQIPHITLAEVRQLGAALTDPAPRPTHRRADWLAALPARLWTGAGARLASALVAIGFFELTALQHERYLFTVFAMPVTVRGLQGGGPSFVVYAHDELPQSRVCDPLLSRWRPLRGQMVLNTLTYIIQRATGSARRFPGAPARSARSSDAPYAEVSSQTAPAAGRRRHRYSPSDSWD
jgi:hypothetical protein